MNGHAAQNIFPSHKRVLAIEGGGFYGISTLLFLEAVVNAASKRLGTQVPLKPFELFDIICGTSAGGVIALLLARYQMSCDEALETYKRLSFRLFVNPGSFWQNIASQVPFDPTKYKEVLAGEVKDQTILENTEGAHKGKALVYVTADAPTYDNQHYAIRSYPPPADALPSPPSKWTLPHAAATAVANHYFIEPYGIDGRHVFRDGGFSGCVNPLDMALEEVAKLWPGEAVGAVVGIGSPLYKFIPDMASPLTSSERRNSVRRWEKEMRKAFNATGTPPSKATELHARNLTEQLVMLAEESHGIHLHLEKTLAPGTYFHVRAECDLPPITLVDCFSDAERSVREWLSLDETQRLIVDIAERIVNDGRNIAPVVPMNVNKDYNPVLDEPRPTKVTEYLRLYHVLFVIDDSGSMGKEGRWNEARDALMDIAEHAHRLKTKTVDIQFLNNRKKNITSLQGAESLTKLFSDAPRGLTPTGAVLKEILDAHIKLLDSSIGTDAYRSIAPLDIIVLTDGIPDDEPAEIIGGSVEKLQISKHHPNCVGIQFVQIGNDPGAGPALDKLKYGQIGDIVDSVPYNGRLTPKRLNRILLGGLQPSVRSMISSLRR